MVISGRKPNRETFHTPNAGLATSVVADATDGHFGIEELMKGELPMAYFEDILDVAHSAGFNELGLGSTRSRGLLTTLACRGSTNLE